MKGGILIKELDDIYKQLQPVYGIPDEIQIEHKKVTLDYTDVTGGKSTEITIAEIPPNCVLIQSSLYMSTIFSNGGSLYAKFSLGLGTDEASGIDYPETYEYRKLIFDSLDLDTLGVNYPNGQISGSDADKTLNKYQNTVVAYFDTLGVWTASNDLNTGRGWLAGCGTQTAGLSIGGNTGVDVGTTEEYDGTCWANSNVLLNDRNGLIGFGTQTAAVCAGGSGNTTDTEEYDGTSWTAANALNVGNVYFGGCGASSTAGLASSGRTGGGGTQIANTEEYDGTSWVTGNDCNIARYLLWCVGIQSAALNFGGYDASLYYDSTEEYDGTNWSIANNMVTAVDAQAGCGTQSSALSFGGSDGVSTSIQSCSEYDGVAWLTTNDVSVGKQNTGGLGTQSAGLAFGGATTIATTEEYSPAYLSDLTQGSLELFLTYTYQG